MILYAYCLFCLTWRNFDVNDAGTHKSCHACHRTSRLNAMQLEIVRNRK
jgi:hypothetical protein